MDKNVQSGILAIIVLVMWIGIIVWDIRQRKNKND